MKQLFILCLGAVIVSSFPLTVHGQEPDVLPSQPPLSKTSKEIESPGDETIDGNSTVTGKEKEFEFCGQSVNLLSRQRRVKLRNELRIISRFSTTLLQRANYYFPIVEPILRENNIPDDFKYLMVIESAMNPGARSNMGAAGIWQFMLGTANDYGLQVNERVDERFHIEKATSAACSYLNDAYKRFGDWVAVAQSYNIGQARISNELNRQQVDDALDLDLMEETNRYIYRIFAAKMIFTHPIDFGLSENMLYYKKMRQPKRQRK